MSGGALTARLGSRSTKHVGPQFVAGDAGIGLDHEDVPGWDRAQPLDPLVDCLGGHLQVARNGGLRHLVSVDGCLDCAHG